MQPRASPTRSRAWWAHEQHRAAPKLLAPPRGAGAQRHGGTMKHAVKNIHFVGIGGAGMSGIAEILHNLGYAISGSDQSESASTKALAAHGIRVSIGHAADHIAGADAVVTSSAVRSDNPEVTAARARRIPVVPVSYT